MLTRLIQYCIELTRNQWLRNKDLRELQDKRLAAIVKHAYENVELYRRKWDEAGVTPRDIRGVDDLVKLPHVTKKEILNEMEKGYFARGYFFEDCLRKTTSGTSGGPMSVYYDERFWDYVVAAYYRLRMAVGFKPWYKCFRIWGQPLSLSDGPSDYKRRSHYRNALGFSHFFLKRLQKTVFMEDTADEIVGQILDFKPDVLAGCPSYLRLVAEKLEENGQRLGIKLILTGGEVLDDFTRRFLEKSFSCNVFDPYWANEIGSISWECEKREGQHINADLLVLETIRAGESVSPGEIGEIVITNLMNYALPLIRYHTGDVGVLGHELCSCGRNLPILKSLEGRDVDCFTLANGQRITPKAIIHAIQGAYGVSRFQAVQQTPNKVTIELMRRGKDPDVSVSELISRCKEILGDDMEIQVTIRDRYMLRSKFRPVISKQTVKGELRWINPRN